MAGILSLLGLVVLAACGAEPLEEESLGEAEQLLSTVEDQRFRVYGALNVKGVDFPNRTGGGSAESCARGDCNTDFITVGQLNDRQWGPYAGSDTDTVFKRWFFLRGERPRRWDCSTGLDFSVTNWISTSRCIDQMGSDKYEELVGNFFGVKKSLAYKWDVLNAQLTAEIPYLPTIIRNWFRAHGTSKPLVFEVGNEPNVFPAMTPQMYAAYYTRWVEEIRKAKAQVAPEFGGSLDVKTMPAGLWISEGEPSYLRNVLDQGVAVAIGRITISVPTGVGMCGSWFRYPCVKFRDYDLTPGVDIKGRLYMDTRAYLDQFLAAVPAGTIDYGNLHFYPYVGPDSSYGENTMAPHLGNLRALASTYAARANSGQVWLTEIGNFNPFNEDDTIKKMMTPALTALKANEIPEITRFYWFKNQGEDKKLSMLPSGANSLWFVAALVAGDAYIKYLDAMLGPLVTIKRPVTDSVTVAKIAGLLGKFSAQSPLQGLKDKDGRLRAMGNVYYNFALAPAAGGQCNGTAGQWNGCRGAGCWVCAEMVAAYPNYFRNHPNCLRNTTCAGQFYQCNAACPEPDETDR
jgi:hypothetical protein